jgi:hypothetical protein
MATVRRWHDSVVLRESRDGAAGCFIEPKSHVRVGFPGQELLVADDAAAHVDRAGGADAVRLRTGPRHLGDRRRPARPRLGVVEHLEQLLGGDVQVDGADEAERRTVNEVQADALTGVHGHTP